MNLESCVDDARTTQVCANIATPQLCVETSGAASGELLSSPMPAALLLDMDEDGTRDTCFRLGASVYDGESGASDEGDGSGFSLELIDRCERFSINREYTTSLAIFVPLLVGHAPRHTPSQLGSRNRRLCSLHRR